MISTNPLCASASHLPNFQKNEFRSLDFSKADFDEVNARLEAVDWNILRESSSTEEFTKLFTSKLLDICLETIPRKQISRGKSKALNGLRRKKQRLQARIAAMKSRPNFDISHLQNLERQLALVVYEIKDSYDEQAANREKVAISKIKRHPKSFYSHAKSFSSFKSSIAMLLNRLGDVVTDKQDMANILQEQFTSVYSDPLSPDIKAPTFDCPILQIHYQTKGCVSLWPT